MNYWHLKNSALKYVLFVLVFCSHNLSFAQQDSLPTAKKIKLEEAILLGIQNNKQLKIANANLAIANENVDQAKIAKMPRIGLSAGYTYIGDPKLYEGFYENNITVDYLNHMGFANVVSAVPIYSGGSINNRIEQQKLLSQMQESVVKMTEADVKNAITEQYFTLEKLYRQIEVTKQNIINTDLRISQLKSRVNNGQNLKSDLLRTELQQSNFKVSVFRSTNTIELISNYLDILIGFPTNTILKPEVTESMIPTENLDLQQSLKEAFQNREELKRAEIGIQLSESSLSLTKSGFLPNINANLILNTEYPAQWPTYVNILNYWAAGLSLSWDVSSFYTLKHRISGDKLEIDKSNIALAVTKDQIGTEVKNAYVRYVESKENIKTFKKDVELSMSNYKIVKSRYDNDFALISEIVDAELQLNNSRIELVNANLDLIIQYYSLQYAMGKL
ncbi:TolC family protein [Flavobacterium saccharophilum]|uniref:Outer membrane protein TolC n=1 Tax=Flavobacterium saccharophilum TaxID=29534 RepID=A0A1M7DC46_9FLAO|nr:TolC family protein [Flavobacterium saccharophilum]SHL77101.1 Outer membrane protein TolC [Flavobacterium saccharophilum]